MRRLIIPHLRGFVNIFRHRGLFGKCWAGRKGGEKQREALRRAPLIICKVALFINSEILQGEKVREPDFRLWRRLARPAPGECLAVRAAPRSSGGETEPASRAACGEGQFRRATPANTKGSPIGEPFVLAGVAGFEPAKMPESKSGALPLGYTPRDSVNLLVLYHNLFLMSRTFLQFSYLFLALF